MDNENEWRVRVDDGPDRLDRWLHRRLDGASMSWVRQAIKDGRVRVDGRRARKGSRVCAGSDVVVYGAPIGEVPIARSGDLQVAYDDEVLAIVDKPAGMATQPLSPEDDSTLVNLTVSRWPETRGVGSKPLEPGLIHRLDAGTRGLVMLAKSPDVFETIRRDLGMGRVKKTYRALVWGGPKHDGGEIDTPLAPTGKKGRIMAASSPGKARRAPQQALTRYRVIERGAEVSLVELDLVTGVTHQLRAHLALLGHPVLGDDRYGDRPEPGSTSFALQAAELGLTHPLSGKRLEVKVEKPLGMDDAGEWKKER